MFWVILQARLALEAADDVADRGFDCGDLAEEPEMEMAQGAAAAADASDVLMSLAVGLPVQANEPGLMGLRRSQPGPLSDF